MFEVLWPQVQHAHRWLATQSGEEADELCIHYPMTAQPCWISLLPAHERLDRLRAAHTAAYRLADVNASGALSHYLGGAYLELGDAAKAAARFDEALGVSLTHRDPRTEAQDRVGLGRAYLELGWPQRAIHHLHRALDLVRDTNDHLGEALVMRSLARGYRALNRMRIGHEYAQQAAAVLSDLGQDLAAAATLGESLLDLGEVDPDHRGYQALLFQARRAPNTDERIGALLRLSRGHLRLEQPSHAIPLLIEALDVAGKQAGVHKEIAVLDVATEAAIAIHDFEQALTFADRRVRLAEQIDDIQQRWAALIKLGEVYRLLNRHHDALATHGDAIRLAQQISPYLREDDRLDLSDVPQRDLPDAIFGMSAAANAYGITYAALAADHHAAGDLAEAVSHWELALRSPLESSFEACVLGDLAMACADTGEYSKAIECHEQQLMIIRESGDRAAEADMLGEIANVYRAQGDPARAIDYYQSAYAIDVQIGAYSDMTNVLINLAGTEFESGHPRRALGYALRSATLARNGRDVQTLAYVETVADHIARAQPDDTSRGDSESPTEAGDVEAARMKLERAAQTGDPAAAAHLAQLLRANGGNVESWLTVALTDGCPDSADAANVAGTLLLEAGQPEKARAAFEKAIVLTKGHAGAMLNLGRTLELLDDRLGAREAYQYAARTDDLFVQAPALLSLGRMLSLEGDQAGALEAYRRAAAADDPKSSPLAWLRIAWHALRKDDLTTAANAADQALASGHLDAVPAALIISGVVMMWRGDRTGAASALRRAISTARSTDQAAEATLNLAVMLDSAEAERLWLSIPVLHDDRLDPHVASRLADVRLRRGDRVGAMSAWLDRTDGDAASAVRAALTLSRSLLAQDLREQAGAVLEQAILFEDAETLSGTVDDRIKLLEDRDRIAFFLREAVDIGGPELRPLGAVRLGSLYYHQLDDSTAARAAWAVAVDSRHPEHAPHALYEMAVALEQEHNSAGARVLYERVIAAGTANITPYAAINLSAILAAQQDLDEADAMLDIAIESDNTEQAGMAWINRGFLRLRRRDIVGAREAWRRALGSGPVPNEMAMRNLELLSADRVTAQVTQDQPVTGGENLQA
ncbi:tetratricopeptide repeat protein [Lentzea sp. NPDC051213]|uniref:tetratricopeptide repeat protein n=1 Tax=Lentzea sp. NPDC051213 TaxID=3364126 RepID=UPI0037B26DE5